jgi:hypothetical protein
MVSDGLVRSVRCPGCGRLPGMVVSPVQAFCGNDDCTAFMWDMTGRAERFKAVAVPIDLSPLDGMVAGRADAGSAGEVVDPVEEQAAQAAAEADVRAGLHRVGARCAHGCPVCDPGLVLSTAQVLVVQDMLVRALLAARQAGVGSDFAALEERFGYPGLQVALQMLRGEAGA